MSSSPTQRREVRWERMFPDELERAFVECPLVYFPYGLCEPHGPQCALGLDALKAHAIACRAAHEGGGIVAPPDYWHIHVRLFGLPDFEANQPGFDGATGDHAGKVETSLLWAVEPECVDVSRLPPREQPGPHFAMGESAHQSDRRVGERMVADEAAWLVRKARELLDAADRATPAQRLRSFAQVEALWNDVVAPRLSEFKTLQMWGDSPAPPEGSIWRTNWEIP